MYKVVLYLNQLCLLPAYVFAVQKLIKKVVFKMLYPRMIGILILFSMQLPGVSAEEPPIPPLFEAADLADVPAAYQGRFRPMEAYARLWLSGFYHMESIKKEDLKKFITQTASAQDFLWKIHFRGHQIWDDSPLFWIPKAEIKGLLDLDMRQDRFSYAALNEAFYSKKETNLKVIKTLIPYYFWKIAQNSSVRPKKGKYELSQLSPGLWISLEDGFLRILALPPEPFWNHLKPGDVVVDLNEDPSPASAKNTVEELQTLLAKLNEFALYTSGTPQVDLAYLESYQAIAGSGMAPADIAQQLEAKHPLIYRLRQAGTTLRVLPGKHPSGEWYSLKALKTVIYNPKTRALEPPGNFTAYSDALFKQIRNTYIRLDSLMLRLQEAGWSEQKEILLLAGELGSLLEQGYALLGGSPFTATARNVLKYPTQGQLLAENAYHFYPFNAACIGLYSLALLGFAFSLTLRNKGFTFAGLLFLAAAFAVHTSILALRSYILARPPVSNMFETVIYVPWIAVAASIFAYARKPHPAGLISSSLAALLLLVVLKLTGLNSGLDNVQAVLDSQFWLIIHVLMVVGSYGVFILCGILGHLYLSGFAFKGSETPGLKFLGRFILQTMYAGVALLIPGTILGGVWAAESWGRFWDWDPKESWAFISICVYIAWIHAYTFRKISNFGLAIGAVSGLTAISFTWYGVNYILGTGLHSYGFGSGGEIYYYDFLAFEALFLICTIFCSKRQKKKFSSC